MLSMNLSRHLHSARIFFLSVLKFFNVIEQTASPATIIDFHKGNVISFVVELFQILNQ